MDQAVSDGESCHPLVYLIHFVNILMIQSQRNLQMYFKFCEQIQKHSSIVSICSSCFHTKLETHFLFFFSFSRQWYEPFAFLRDERSSILIGLLTSVNSIEFNLFVKNDPNQSQNPPLDLSLYAKEIMPGFCFDPNLLIQASSNLHLSFLHSRAVDIKERKVPVPVKKEKIKESSLDHGKDKGEQETRERRATSLIQSQETDESSSSMKKAYQTLVQQNSYLEEINKSLQVTFHCNHFFSFSSSSKYRS